MFSVPGKCSLRPGPVSMGPPASHGPGLDFCQAFLHSLTVSRHADTPPLAPKGSFGCKQRIRFDIYFDQRVPGVPTCREACIGLPRYVSSGAAASDGPWDSKTRPRGTHPDGRVPEPQKSVFSRGMRAQAARSKLGEILRRSPYPLVMGSGGGNRW